MIEECKHGNISPKDTLQQLPIYQAGLGRHKCVVCAYEQGLKSESSAQDLEQEECSHGHRAPVSVLKSLQENQGGLGRHRCAICAYHQGIIDNGIVKPDIVEDIKKIDNDVPDITQKTALISARIGQGDFRRSVLNIEKKCRVTGVEESMFLIASHIKPWRVSNNVERLDGNNGLLLSPHIDKLFDLGHISFNDDGAILSSALAKKNLVIWGVDINQNFGEFNESQKAYLQWHRNNYKDSLV